MSPAHPVRLLRAATDDCDGSLQVHVLAGLPTEAIRRALQDIGEGVPIAPLDALAEPAGGTARIGVLLPAHVEPSQLVESWEACDFLRRRFRRPAHIASVTSFIDVDQVLRQLTSSAPVEHSGRKGCSVAEIVVAQIEAATHLALVGTAPPSDDVARRLGVLNPSAPRSPVRGASTLDRHSGRSARVVPPWLEVLQGESDPAPRRDLLVYRRDRPFDPDRLTAWLADPPQELLRGKGHMWLESEPDRSVIYSCAGSVHRLFPGGRWWASRADGAWPSCATHRRRLLDRWHPRFGDRGQEIVFAAADVDRVRLVADLDACLLPEEAIDNDRIRGMRLH